MKKQEPKNMSESTLALIYFASAINLYLLIKYWDDDRYRWICAFMLVMAMFGCGLYYFEQKRHKQRKQPSLSIPLLMTCANLPSWFTEDAKEDFEERIRRFTFDDSVEDHVKKTLNSFKVKENDII